MSTALAVRDEHHRPSLALAPDQDWWSDKQLAALRQIGVDRAGNGDLAVFMHVCQRTGLDPFARQIYMIERDGKQVIQTGIDGMRLVARRAVDRTGETLSISAPQWCGQDGLWRDVWLEEEPPAAARVTVTRGGGTFSAVALWREYVQRKRDGGITRMWATRGAGQLAKCAEALALRKACPQDLSGVYAEEELQAHHAEPRSGGLGAALRVTAEHIDSPGTPPVGVEGSGGEPTPDSPPDEPDDDPLLDTQSKLARAMHAAFRGADINDRGERLEYASNVVGREVTTSAELRESEARAVVEALKNMRPPVAPEES